MACTSCGKSGSKTTGRSMPKNWGGMNMKSSSKSTGMTGSSTTFKSGGFGAPKVKMSFSGRGK